MVIEFAPGKPGAGPGFEATRATAANHWRNFWSSGGAIDFSVSTERAGEGTGAAGGAVAIPDGDSMRRFGAAAGDRAACNSWYGKFHLEMHWWHAAHFALWGPGGLLEKSLPWYSEILPSAQETARAQGYRGARWPKMVGSMGDSPANMGYC